MNINLEIVDAAMLYGEKEVEGLRTKELVPKMVTRRRLTRAAKIVVDLADTIKFKDGRIVYGSSYGEVLATSNILKSILKSEPISPTDFQNSVYNTAVSYLSMLNGNTDEMMTVSSGDATSLNVLKAGAVKALDGDEILLLATETLNIENIEEVNDCIDFLECGVALKVRVTDKAKTIDYKKKDSLKGFPPSLTDMLAIEKAFQKGEENIIEVSF